MGLENPENLPDFHAVVSFQTKIIAPLAVSRLLNIDHPRGDNDDLIEGGSERR
jgi:hypothetical protein